MRSTLTLLLVTLCVFVCVSPVLSVDRHKFRTCSQTSFCRRTRSPDVREKWNVQQTSVSFDAANQILSAALNNVNYPLQPAIGLQLFVYDNSIVRLVVKEIDGKFERWSVKDAVEQSALKPIKASIQSSNADQKTKLVWSEDGIEYTVTLSYAPFGIQFQLNNDVVMSVNTDNLFSFEQYRDRNPKTTPLAEPVPPQPVDGQSADDVQAAHAKYAEELTAFQQQAAALANAQQAYPYDVEGMWEESFGGHTDNKKRGPSAIGLDVSFMNTKHIYGLPEHASSFSLKNTKNGGSGDYNEPYRLYNLDVFEYELNEPMALYGAVPLIVGHSQDGAYTTGVLWLNAAETFVDVSENAGGVLSGIFGSSEMRKNTHWISEAGQMDAFFIFGPTPKKFYQQYTELTGFPFMPPQFSIAYHQCRWNYKSGEDVAAVDAGFDEHDIPYDTLWLDIEHTDAKKYFTWDKNNFAHPKEMQNALAAKGRHMVTIIDPHVKRDSGYFLHNAATTGGHYVKNSGNNDYEGWCWPGSSSYLDFFRQSVRDFWKQYFAYQTYEGSTPSLFTWNDMNEPSVFNGPEVTMPKDNLHLIGENGAGVEHREVHNQYGYYNHRGTFEGLLARDQNKQRPFVLTRSFFAGSQKYAAVWTGDNKAEWSHLNAAQPMLLSLAVAQIPFSGADVGGFFGNPDAQLTTRWYQAAAFHPFFRGHAHIDTKRREPWLFGEPYTAHIRAAIRQRYAYLPYVYTLFYENHKTGFPIMRPLWLEFPNDVATFPMENQFLLGANILVKPVVEPDTQTTIVYLPAQPNTQQYWYDLESDAKHLGPTTVNVLTPLSSIPVFQRGGTITSKRERARRSSPLMKFDPYTLVIALDANGSATGTLYIDDNNSYDYLQGAFVYRTFTYANGQLQSTGAPSTFQDNNTIERIVILGGNGLKSAVVVSGVNRDGQAVSNVQLQVNAINNGKRIVVKKPDVKISADFTIKFQ